MPQTSRSLSTESNPNLREESARDGEGNKKLLARLGDGDGIIFLGGTSVADFRVRVAQSSLRSDMLPSFWSQCGILQGNGTFASVPLDLGNDVSAIPRCNAVQVCSLDDYDDPQRYPNVAVVRFAKAHARVDQDIERLKNDRAIVDLAALMLPWLGFVWGTGGSSNPLSQGIGLPSAAFVETVFAMAGFELTPGLSSASSCPEAIWQSAKWWTDFYKGITADAAPRKSAKTKSGKEKTADAVPMTPQGYFAVRQRAAAAAG
jgi:hypothetical protein